MPVREMVMLCETEVLPPTNVPGTKFIAGELDVSPVTPPKSVPVRVMVTVLPGGAEAGLMPVRAGRPVIVKVTEVGAVPLAPVTLMA